MASTTRWLLGSMIVLPLTLLFASLPTPQASAQRGTYSADSVMAGCRALISNREQDLLLQGVCAGTINALAGLPSGTMGYCIPDGPTTGQAVRVEMRET
jgi:hypothetical protein